jgi:hypothetical protein
VNVKCDQWRIKSFCNLAVIMDILMFQIYVSPSHAKTMENVSTWLITLSADVLEVIMDHSVKWKVMQTDNHSSHVHGSFNKLHNRNHVSDVVIITKLLHFKCCPSVATCLWQHLLSCLEHFSKSPQVTLCNALFKVIHNFCCDLELTFCNVVRHKIARREIRT